MLRRGNNIVIIQHIAISPLSFCFIIIKVYFIIYYLCSIIHYLTLFSASYWLKLHEYMCISWFINSRQHFYSTITSIKKLECVFLSTCSSIILYFLVTLSTSTIHFWFCIYLSNLYFVLELKLFSIISIVNYFYCSIKNYSKT